MTDTDLIKAAQEKLARYRAEVHRLEAFLETAQELTAGPDKKKAHIAPPRSAKKDAPASGDATPRKEVLQQTHQILLEQRRRLPAAAIYDILIKRGVVIAGKSPKGNLTAKFATDKTLSYDKDTGLWTSDALESLLAQKG